MDIDLPSVSQCSELPKITKKQSRRKNMQTAPDLCEVCFGKATGYHYGVATCNGCKAFFRRMIAEKLNYTCKLLKKCFDLLQPGQPMPRCRACRFKKCVESGMNSIGIEWELDKKKQGIIEKPRQTVEAKIGELIDKLLRLDAQSEKFRDCAFNPQEFPSLKSCVKQDKSILPIADQYGPMKGWPLQKGTIECGKSYSNVKKWIVYEVWTQVEMAKALPFFSDLSESDRFYLFQDTLLMSTNLTRSFYSFEQKSDRLLRPDGLMCYDSPLPFHDELRTRIRDDISIKCLTPMLRVGMDRVEFVLLRALVLTNPSVPEISEIAQKYLTRVQQKYSTALFRYIMAKHGASGPARLANILGFIDVLERQQKEIRGISLIMRFKKPKHFTIAMLDDIMK